MGLLLYRLSILFYQWGIFLVQPWNKKARLWVEGRKQVLEKLADWRKDHPQPLIWMHCASLGEFEQGRPVLEEIRIKYPNHLIALSFFSPSGFEVRKNYPGADYIFYLPVDSVANAQRLVSTLSPALTIWVKYEYWYFYLRALYQRRVPVVLISALFRPHQPFFRWYGTLHRELLSFFTMICVQDQHSQDLLAQVTPQTPILVAGDTRFDRVLAIQASASDLWDIQAFAQGHFTIIGGSSWPEDEEVLDHFILTHPQVKCILAPHEIDEEHLVYIEKLFKHTARYSEWKHHPDHQIQTLIIDNIGMLSTLYRYADCAFLGGGFGNGIHNVLEAAAYGIPVLFGPNHEKFKEAVDLTEIGAAFCVQEALETERQLTAIMEDPQLRQTAGQLAATYVEKGGGATAIIMNQVTNLLRTNAQK
jgi:3-deoxy-D-manno-octulosonic-acid transferase